MTYVVTKSLLRDALLVYKGKEEEYFALSGWGESDVDLCFVGVPVDEVKSRVVEFYRSLKKSHPKVISLI